MLHLRRVVARAPVAIRSRGFSSQSRSFNARVTPRTYATLLAVLAPVGYLTYLQSTPAQADNAKASADLIKVDDIKTDPVYLTEDDLKPQPPQAYDPETGEINWDCPCLGGMASGPCGPEFKEAFACFVYSKEEPKGADCISKFSAMQACFREHPEVYAEQLQGDEELTGNAHESHEAHGITETANEIAASAKDLSEEAARRFDSAREHWETRAKEFQDSTSKRIAELQSASVNTTKDLENWAKEQSDALRASGRQAYDDVHRAAYEYYRKAQDSGDEARLQANKYYDEVTREVTEYYNQANASADALTKSVNDGLNQTKASVNNVYADAQKAATEYWNKTQDQGVSLQKTISEQLHSAQDTFNSYYNQIESQAAAVEESVKSSATEIYNSAQKSATDLQKATEEKLAKARASAKDLYDDAARKVQKTSDDVDELEKSVSARVRKAQQQAKKDAQKIVDAVRHEPENLRKGAKEVGDIVHAHVELAKADGERVLEAIKEEPAKFKQGLKDAEKAIKESDYKIRSPSEESTFNEQLKKDFVKDAKKLGERLQQDYTTFVNSQNDKTFMENLRDDTKTLHDRFQKDLSTFRGSSAGKYLEKNFNEDALKLENRARHDIGLKERIPGAAPTGTATGAAPAAATTPVAASTATPTTAPPPYTEHSDAPVKN